MLKFARLAMLAAAVVSAGVTATSPALAGGRHDRWHGRGEPVGRVNDDALALGLFGLAAGVIAGSVIASQPREPRYVEPDYVEPRRYVEPEYEPEYRREPAYGYDNDFPPPPVRANAGAGAEAWSPEWYRYCQSRYRSFDPQNGTFIGFDNRRHFCTAG